MVLIRAKQVRAKVKILKNIIKEYKEQNPKKDRDYLAYEKSFKKRLKYAINVSTQYSEVNSKYFCKDY